MSTLESLKAAVEAQDWDTVAKLTEQIKVEQAEPPKKKRGRPRKVQTPNTTVIAPAPVNRVRSKSLNPTFNNKFKDDRTEHTDDTKKFDKVVYKGIHTERREAAQTIQVHCDKCKTVCNIFPKHLIPSLDKGSGPLYICDGCLARR